MSLSARILFTVLFLASVGRAETGEIFGPASRDESGRYENPQPLGPTAGPSVTIPFGLRRVIGAFRERPNAPERIENDGAFLRASAKSGQPTVTWIGHATVLVQLGNVTFLTDPVWSDTASPISFIGPRRHVAPGMTLADLPPIDFVLLSHNHYDHLDLRTLDDLARRDPNTHYYVPLGNAELLTDRGIQNVYELDWGQEAEYDQVKITCLPSQHFSARGLLDRNRALWASWAVKGPDRNFYFAGDTAAFRGLTAIGETLGPFDLAAIPIGATEPTEMMRPFHLDGEEAVEAGRALRATRLVPIHFGTFDLSDEPLDRPPRRFLEAGPAAGYALEDLWVLKVGETRTF